MQGTWLVFPVLFLQRWGAWYGAPTLCCPGRMSEPVVPLSFYGSPFRHVGVNQTAFLPFSQTPCCSFPTVSLVGELFCSSSSHFSVRVALHVILVLIHSWGRWVWVFLPHLSSPPFPPSVAYLFPCEWAITFLNLFLNLAFFPCEWAVTFFKWLQES